MSLKVNPRTARRSPSAPKPSRIPTTIDETDHRGADDAGHSPTCSILTERIQKSDETLKSPNSEASKRNDSKSMTSDSTEDDTFPLRRSRSAKSPKRTTKWRRRNSYNSPSFSPDDKQRRRRPKPRVKRLVAGHLAQIERDTASSIDVYYQSAVPDAVVNAATSTDKSFVGPTNVLRQHVDCPWAVQINSPSVIERLAEVLGVSVTTFPDPLM
jgi:hypothetical protein